MKQLISVGIFYYNTVFSLAACDKLLINLIREVEDGGPVISMTAVKP